MCFFRVILQPPLPPCPPLEGDKGGGTGILSRMCHMIRINEMYIPYTINLNAYAPQES